MLRFIFKLFTTAFVAAIGFGLGVHYGTNEKVAKIEGAIEERLASAVTALESKIKAGKADASADHAAAVGVMQNADVAAAEPAQDQQSAEQTASAAEPAAAPIVEARAEQPANDASPASAEAPQQVASNQEQAPAAAATDDQAGALKTAQAAEPAAAPAGDDAKAKGGDKKKKKKKAKAAKPDAGADKPADPQ
ncbi:MAG: hypothetical protein WAK01_11445 [Methylocystis sp.]